MLIFSRHLTHTIGELLVINISQDTWTNGLYDRPVARIHQHAVDEGPEAAHARFDFVNGAHLVPEDTIPRVRTSKKGSSARPVAILPEKGVWVNMEILGNTLDVSLTHKGATVAFAAFPTQLTFKKI